MDMRIIRTIFFLSAVAILLPTPPEENDRISTTSLDDLSAPQVFTAATRTVSDMSGFCARQPVVCQTTGFIATKLQAKAKYSVKLIYEWANEAGSDYGQQQALDNGLTTASLPAFADAGSASSRNTLKVEDLIPSWRDPARKNG